MPLLYFLEAPSLKYQISPFAKLHLAETPKHKHNPASSLSLTTRTAKRGERSLPGRQQASPSAGSAAHWPLPLGLHPQDPEAPCPLPAPPLTEVWVPGHTSLGGMQVAGGAVVLTCVS